jgi:hypothetical protein
MRACAASEGARMIKLHLWEMINPRILPEFFQTIIVSLFSWPGLKAAGRDFPSDLALDCFQCRIVFLSRSSSRLTPLRRTMNDASEGVGDK